MQWCPPAMRNAIPECAAVGRTTSLLSSVSVETVYRTVKQIKLKAWWHETDEKEQRARIARLRR
jgi:hypothetical protein